MISLGKPSKMPSDIPPTVEASKEEVYYPCLYIEDVEEGLELPEVGTAVINFKIRRKTVTKKEGEDPKVSYDLDVIAIGDVKGSKAKKDRSAELDALAEEVSKEYEDESEEDEED